MHGGIKLVVVVLALASAFAKAQGVDISAPQHPGCMRQNASRLPAPECGMTKPPIITNKEMTMTTKFVIPTMSGDACQARVQIEYSQVASIARVKGTIENETCAASGGNFVIAARVRDAANETKTLEFTEQWLRDDDKILTFSSDYSIGDNVDLVRVQVLKVECKCAKLDKAEK